MGALADSVLNAGGRAIGVEPQFFVEKELQHDGLTQLIVTKDMSERKNKMIELGDAFIFTSIYNISNSKKQLLNLHKIIRKENTFLSFLIGQSLLNHRLATFF